MSQAPPAHTASRRPRQPSGCPRPHRPHAAQAQRSTAQRDVAQRTRRNNGSLAGLPILLAQEASLDAVK